MREAPCPHCGAKTSAALCGKCLRLVRTLVPVAVDTMHELRVETARMGVKARTPGASNGGADPGINLAAVEAMNRINRVLRELCQRARSRYTTKPGGALLENAHHLQRPVWVRPDPLYWLVGYLIDAIAEGQKLIDTPLERRVMGACACGTTLRSYKAHVDVVVCHDCQTISTAGEAKERLRDKLLDAFAGLRLKSDDMVIAIKLCDHNITISDLKAWPNRYPGLITKPGRGGGYLFDEVLHLAELKTIRAQERARQKAA